MGGYVPSSDDFVIPLEENVFENLDQLIYHPEDMEMIPAEENIMIELANDDNANANPLASSSRIVNQVESLQIDATVSRKSHGIVNNG